MEVHKIPCRVCAEQCKGTPTRDEGRARGRNRDHDGDGLYTRNGSVCFTVTMHLYSNRHFSEHRDHRSHSARIPHVAPPPLICVLWRVVNTVRVLKACLFATLVLPRRTLAERRRAVNSPTALPTRPVAMASLQGCPERVQSASTSGRAPEGKGMLNLLTSRRSILEPSEPWCEATASYFIGRWHVSSATPRRDGNDHDRAACNAGDALSTTTQRTLSRSSGAPLSPGQMRQHGVCCHWGARQGPRQPLATYALSARTCCGPRGRELPWVQGVALADTRGDLRPCFARGSRPPTEGCRTMRTSTPRRRDSGRCLPPLATSSSGAPGACDPAGSLVV